jgi:hypothetical protein
MNTLITACLQSKDLQLLVDFPTAMMSELESKICTWVFKYVTDNGSPPTIERLAKAFPDFLPLDSDDPLNDLFEQAILRKRREISLLFASKIVEGVRDENYDPYEDVRKLASQTAFEGSGFVHYSTFDRSEYFRPIRPLKFHFPIIDRVTGGLINGDLCYLVGRLGTGKSTLAQWITHNWWKDDKRILFVSNEMMPIDLLIKFDAMLGRFNPLELRLRKADKVLKDRIEVISHIVASSKGEIIMPRRRLMTPHAVISTAAQLELDAIVIDGVYLMHSDTKSPSKWERVADNSHALKQGALELGIPVLGISQLRRLAGRAEVDIEDIAYSDALGQDADTVIAITPTEVKNTISVELIKSRFGPSIGTTVAIDFDSMSVEDAGGAAVVAKH